MSELLILGLATWRITSLLVTEDGPYDIFGRLRAFLGVRYDEYNSPYGTNVIAQGLLCMWCASVWVGLGFTFIYLANCKVALGLAFPFALSAAAVLVDMLVSKINV